MDKNIERSPDYWAVTSGVLVWMFKCPGCGKTIKKVEAEDPWVCKECGWHE